MSGVADYSKTPASNTAINSIGIAGTNSPANFDNAFRQLMADIATAREDGSLASMPYATKSSGYTLAVTDRGKLIDCTAALEIELLAAASATGFFFIVKANGGAVTLDPNSTESINGSSTSLVIADGLSAIVACNGTAWFAISIGQGDVTQTGTQTLTNKTLTSPIINTSLELGHATDNTLTASSGVLSIEGKRLVDVSTQNQPVTGGATVTSLALNSGSAVTSGTLTLDVGDCPLQHYTNGGAHTLAPGSVTGAITLDITNNGSAGAITTSGFTKVAGDSFTTTNGHKFRCHASVGNAGSLLIVQALQ